MVRPIKNATATVYHDATREALAAHVQAFIMAYNFAKRPKRIRSCTRFERIGEHWRAEPAAFRIDPHQFIPGPHPERRRRAVAARGGSRANGR